MKVHLFNVEEAKKYGVEKAVIIYNLRFWLEKNKANGSNEHDGYYWTYNSAEAFSDLFPYFTQSKIGRMLRQLEDDGVIISGCYNNKGYDRTKWYSMPEFKVAEIQDEDSSKPCDYSYFKNEECNFQNCTMDISYLNNGYFKNEQPIPYVNTDSNPDSNSYINKGATKNSKTFKPEKPETVSDEVWNDLLAHRKTKRTSNTKTAWSAIYNQLDKAQQQTGDSLDQIIGEWLSRDWKGFKAQWYINATAESKVGGNYATYQPVSNSGSKRETQEEFEARLQREFDDLRSSSI